MARVKIDVPDKFLYTTHIPVRITDLNYGGHVGNDTILSLIHEARIQFLSHYGYGELNMEGVGLIMSDSAIEYKKEMYYGDILEVSMAITEFSRVGFDLVYRLDVERNQKRLCVAVGKTGMVCFDYKKRKMAHMPETARKKLATTP